MNHKFILTDSEYKCKNCNQTLRDIICLAPNKTYKRFKNSKTYIIDIINEESPCTSEGKLSALLS